MRAWTLRVALPGVLALTGCMASSPSGQPGGAASAAATAPRPACDAGNGGITLPSGFCAVVVADVSPRPRHLAVSPRGDVYVAFLGQANAATVAERGGVVALRDTNGDGRADERAYFGPEGGTGMEIRGDRLYFGTNTAILRYRLGAGLEPVSGPDTIVHGLPAQPGHTAKPIALGNDGSLFVSVGSPGNACQPQAQDRKAGVPGEDPCGQLATRGGVWRFDADRLRQTQAQGERWATGVRNAVALAFNPFDKTPYAVAHGREALEVWPGFTVEDNAVRVAEEFQRLTRGSDFGWPYCYFDFVQNRRVLMPEYGGDGRQVGRCAEKDSPILTFPAHWAPNDLHFYTGEQFPQRYRGGAFVAFHGAGSPAHPGHRVAFVPFRGSEPAGPYEIFAEGFAGADAANPVHRPMGLAEGPDGSLYIADSKGGRIWRVMYTGR